MSLVSWCGASGVCCGCWGGVGVGLVWVVGGVVGGWCGWCWWVMLVGFLFSLGSPVAVCLFSKCYVCVCCLLLASVLVPVLLSVSVCLLPLLSVCITVYRVGLRSSGLFDNPVY